MVVQSIEQRIADELEVGENQVRAAVALLDEGSTVPFIARYRKEVTGMLDDAQLRTLEERLRYLRELEERRQTVLDSIESQGKLDDALKASILAADTKSRLEDIYLPFKPKRRTKAMIARENGLEPLADGLMADPDVEPIAAAAVFVNADVPDPQAALDGARSILVERFAEDADLIGSSRERLWEQAGWPPRSVRARRRTGRSSRTTSTSTSRSRRCRHTGSCAVPRRERRRADDHHRPLPAGVEVDGPTDYETTIARKVGVDNQGRPADKWLVETVRWAWRTKILVHLGIDLRMRLRQVAEDEAIRVFAANLRDLLLAAPPAPAPRWASTRASAPA